MNSSKITSPWVLLDINNTVYAVSCKSVLSLSQLPEVTPVPKSPLEVRGVIKFRGKVIQLVDTRKILNLTTIPDEIDAFCKMIDQRYQDHLNWIKTLEKTVKDDTEFTLTTDPHKCAFGKWYDSFSSKNTNIMFLSTFKKFDEPHKAIHQIAITAKELIEKGDKQAAIELIESVKNTELKQMLHLFDDIKEAYKESRKETSIVIGENEENCVSLSVDQIVAIEHLNDIDEDLIRESLTKTKYLAGLGKRKNDTVAFLLNDEYIFNKFH